MWVNICIACTLTLVNAFISDKGRGAIRADFGPMSEINFVVVTI